MFGPDPTTPQGDERGFGTAGEISVDQVAALQAQEREAEAPDAAEVDASRFTLFARRTVSGRYRGERSPWQLELRIDVDGDDPLGMVSGDFYRVAGSTVSYYGSFTCAAVAVTTSSTVVTITGDFEATFRTSFSRIQISIPRVFRHQRRADATIQFLNQQDRPGARYTGAFESTSFRTVHLEEDHTPGIDRFSSFDTGALPGGGSTRALSITTAYAEAGIELLATGGSNIVPDDEAVTDQRPTWSNAELHASMVRHFSFWENRPGWQVWLLHAELHDIGDRLLGIMFDQEGRQRQGAATFYARQGGNMPGQRRSQLYTCVHELGHCFNLYHSFHKIHMRPPQSNRLDALSWMNYPDRFPGGTAAYWRDFPFQFDREELIHLRHAFRDNIIMGGAAFGSGAALYQEDGFRDVVQNDSGLRLELLADGSFALGEPVSIQIRLSVTDTRGRRVNGQIHPNFGFVQLAIGKPSGSVVRYEPLLTHCLADEDLYLDDGQPAIETSAYIGYGRGGHYFDQTGYYRIQARYYAPDGSEVPSNVLTLRVRSPLSAADEEMADLFLDNDQGALLYLLGSDAQELHSGDEAFELVLDKHPDHPLADYARIVKANNAVRRFKLITPDNRLTVRPSQPGQAQALLAADGAAAAFESTRGGGGSALLQQLQARAQVKVGRAGERALASATAFESSRDARQPGLPAHIASFCVAQTQEVAREFAEMEEESGADSPGGEDPTANEAAAGRSRRRSRRKPGEE